MVFENHLTALGIRHDWLGQTLRVYGHLDLNGSPLMELPVDLHVGGDFNLADSAALSLPEKLRVDGTLDISNTRINRIPAEAMCGASVILRNCKLPEGLPFTDVKGDLDLSGAEVGPLREGLDVWGSLNLYCCSLEELPEDLKVGRRLYLAGSRIRRLPPRLWVAGDLVVSSLPLFGRRGADIFVGGKIVLDNRIDPVTEPKFDSRLSLHPSPER